MKRKIIMPLVILLSLMVILIIAKIFLFNTRETNKKIDTIKTEENKNQNNKDINSFDKEEVNIEESNHDENVKEEKIDNNDSNTNNQISSPSKNNTTSDQRNIVTEQPSQNNQVAQEQPKPNGILESYGLTEDEYYNKPARKWETVDFSVDVYGSQSAAHAACDESGKNHFATTDEDGYFSCGAVNSTSGRYLGEHIKYYELES